MEQERKSQKATVQIQRALEESCSALITLESLRAAFDDGAAEELRSPIEQAIECLRQAIAELRAAAGEDRQILPGEFVLRAGDSGDAIRRRYTSPRRTA